MSDPFSWTNREFDQYAAEYDAALDRGLSWSGEDKHYFAHGRIAWLAERLRRLGKRPRQLPRFWFLFSLLEAEQVIGVTVPLISTPSRSSSPTLQRSSFSRYSFLTCLNAS